MNEGSTTKGLFGKSPLKSQKLSPKLSGVFEQSSLAHLSPKERCVRIFKGFLGGEAP